MNIVNIFVYFCLLKGKYKVEGNMRSFKPKNIFSINMQLLYACMTFSIPLPLFSTSFPLTYRNKDIEFNFLFLTWFCGLEFCLYSNHVLLATLLFVSVYSMSSSNLSHSLLTLRTSLGSVMKTLVKVQLICTILKLEVNPPTGSEPRLLL